MHKNGQTDGQTHRRIHMKKKANNLFHHFVNSPQKNIMGRVFNGCDLLFFCNAESLYLCVI